MAAGSGLTKLGTSRDCVLTEARHPVATVEPERRGLFRVRPECFAHNIEQGATHVSGLPASLTAAAAKERMRVGTSRPLAALAV